MKNREAIEILSRPFDMKNVPQDILEAHKMAISALEKQERECVKPIRFPDGNRPYEGICGYCHKGTFLWGSMYTDSQYCGCCGRKIDWSDEHGTD